MAEPRAKLLLSVRAACGAMPDMLAQPVTSSAANASVTEVLAVWRCRWGRIEKRMVGRESPVFSLKNLLVQMDNGKRFQKTPKTRRARSPRGYRLVGHPADLRT